MGERMILKFTHNLLSTVDLHQMEHQFEKIFQVPSYEVISKHTL
jgi:hypothetical protein